MGIDITAYDCRRSCEFWLDPKGEGVALSQDLNYFRTGTQPSFPKGLKSGPYRHTCDNTLDICYRIYTRQLSDTGSTFDIF